MAGPQTSKSAAVRSDHPDTLASYNALAYAYTSAGRVDEAIALYEQNLADAERLLGPDHPDTLIARNNLGRAYHSAGRLPDTLTPLKQNLTDR
ncbi:tetratricopeptide repeat protein [Nocardia sp. NPDC059691]|uniref:tetratricopeptide repeat protein n=1 Tax=Nocardia sp. NPDC059691 TaxID=3346908 RepID=UPI00368B739C